MIPKIIWQTHEWEYEELPDNYKRNSDSWKNLNSEYEYKYISSTDRRKMMEVLGYAKEYDKIINNRQKSELWRYVIMANFGGIYVDMDCICLSPLNINHDENLLIQKKIIKPQDYFNGYFACSKNNEVVLSFCNKILNFINSKEDPITYEDMSITEWNNHLELYQNKFKEIYFDIYSSTILQNENIKNINFIIKSKYPFIKISNDLYIYEDVVLSNIFNKKNINLKKNKEILFKKKYIKKINKAIKIAGFKIIKGPTLFTIPSDYPEPEKDNFSLILFLNNDFGGGEFIFDKISIKPIARMIFIINNNKKWDFEKVYYKSLSMLLYECEKV